MARDRIEVLYINFIVQNGAEAVKHKVNKKLQKSKVLPSSVAKGAAQAASDFATPRAVARMMSQEMCRKFPKKMLAKGLTVDMKEVFREGPYVVLQMKVTRVDASAVVLAPSSENWFFWNLMEFVGAGSHQDFEENHLPVLVTRHLHFIMPNLLSEGMVLKKVEAETKVLTEKKQAHYFYEKLREVREQEEARRKRNPITGWIRKRPNKESPFEHPGEDDESVGSCSFSRMRMRLANIGADDESVGSSIKSASA